MADTGSASWGGAIKHAIITILLCALATGAQEQEAKTFRKPDGLPNSPGCSQAVEITKGKLVILAGQMPVDDKGQLVGGGDFKAQATRAFQNIVLALKAAGLDTSDYFI